MNPTPSDSRRSVKIKELRGGDVVTLSRGPKHSARLMAASIRKTSAGVPRPGLRSLANGGRLMTSNAKPACDLASHRMTAEAPMATRTKLLFVTFPEFATWLRETIDQLCARVVLERITPRAPLEHWDGSDEMLASAFRAWITTEAPDLTKICPDDLTPGQLGWMDLPVPKTEDGCLLMIQIGAKSDWYDRATGQVNESPVSLRLFDRFWRRWKKHFQFGILDRNPKTGDEAFHSNIGYSIGASDWFRRGGRLRQWGVANAEFMIPDTPG